MTQNLIYGIYLLISDFLVESLKANENQQKRSLILQYSFAKKPHLVYEPQLTQQCKKYAPVTQSKTLLTLHIFKQKCFWLVSKKTFSLQHF